MRTPFFRGLITYLLIVSLLLIGSTHAQAQFLTAPKQSGYQTSSDHNRLVYVNEQSLMSVNLATLKSTTLIDKSYVQDFKLSPDGQYVIYRGDTDLFSVPVDGGTPVDIGAASYEYAVAPDSAFIVYVGPAESGENVFVAPIAGGTPRALITLRETTLAFANPYRFTISPDSKTVLFLAKNERSQTTKLFAASLSGGDSIPLSEPIEFSNARFIFSPDSQSAVLVAAPSAGGSTRQLFKISLQGGATTQLSSADFYLNDSMPLLTPSGDVIYSALVKSSTNLYSSSLENGLTTSIGDNVDSAAFRLTPSGAFVIYRTTEYQNNKLFAVPVAGGTATLIAQTEESIIHFSISRDDAYVVYVTDNTLGNSAPRLFSVPITGGQSVQLNTDDVEVRSFDADMNESKETEWLQRSYFIASIMGRVVYWGHDSEGYQLFSVPLTGGTPTKLNEVPGSAYFDQTFFYPVEDGKQVVFVLDMDTVNMSDLYIVKIDGGKAERLTPPSEYRTLQNNVAVYSPLPEISTKIVPPTVDSTGTGGNTPSTDATAVPAVTLTCPNSPPTRLAVGIQARVTPGDANSVRPSPTSSQVIGKIPGGGQFTVIGGPECGRGDRMYWQVDYNGLQGWTAEGEGSEYWLEPTGGRG